MTSDKQRLTDGINRVERVVKRGLREEYTAEWTNTAHAVLKIYPHSCLRK